MDVSEMGNDAGKKRWIPRIGRRIGMDWTDGTLGSDENAYEKKETENDEPGVLGKEIGKGADHWGEKVPGVRKLRGSAGVN
jgi:hypothetical protein